MCLLLKFKFKSGHTHQRNIFFEPKKELNYSLTQESLRMLKKIRNEWEGVPEKHTGKVISTKNRNHAFYRM